MVLSFWGTGVGQTFPEVFGNPRITLVVLKSLVQIFALMLDQVAQWPLSESHLDHSMGMEGTIVTCNGARWGHLVLVMECGDLCMQRKFTIPLISLPCSQLF